MTQMCTNGGNSKARTEFEPFLTGNSISALNLAGFDVKEIASTHSFNDFDEETLSLTSNSGESYEISEEILEDDASTDTSEWISVESSDDESDSEINYYESNSVQSGSTLYTFCTIEGLSIIYEEGESQCSSQSRATMSKSTTMDGSQLPGHFNSRLNTSFVGEEIFVVADCQSTSTTAFEQIKKRMRFQLLRISLIKGLRARQVSDLKRKRMAYCKDYLETRKRRYDVARKSLQDILPRRMSVLVNKRLEEISKNRKAAFAQAHRRLNFFYSRRLLSKKVKESRMAQRVKHLALLEGTISGARARLARIQMQQYRHLLKLRKSFLMYHGTSVRFYTGGHLEAK